MTLPRIKTHTNDFDILLFQVGDAIAETASFLRATRRIVFRIKVEQDYFFPDDIRHFPGFAILIFAFNQGSFFAGLWRFGCVTPNQGSGRQEKRSEQGDRASGSNLHRIMEMTIVYESFV